MHRNLKHSAQVFIWGNFLIRKTTGSMGRKKETIIAKLENVLTKITAKKPLYFSPF